MSGALESVLISVGAAVIIGVGGLTYRSLSARRRRELEQLAQINRVVVAVIGEPGSADGALLGQPGLLETVAKLSITQDEMWAQQATMRVRQEEIGVAAAAAAEDVAAVRTELTRNGGASTKDAAHQAARSAEAAAAAAEVAAREGAETKALLRRHMANGVDIMAVGLANDTRTVEAFRQLGVDLEFDEYPPVDTGEDT